MVRIATILRFTFSPFPLFTLILELAARGR